MPKKNRATGDPILDALRAERERRGLSQRAVARTIGRNTYQSTYQWESGSSSPTLRCLREWAASLGYDVTLTPLSAQLPEERSDEPMSRFPDNRANAPERSDEGQKKPADCAGCRCCPAGACEPDEPLGPGVCGHTCPCHPDFWREMYDEHFPGLPVDGEGWTGG